MEPKLPGDDAIGIILSKSFRPEVNSYECMLLPARHHEPSEIRRKFLALSLRVHPDRVPDRVADATRAFQKLSVAFETLYDCEKQKQHLEEIRFRLHNQKETERASKNESGGKATADNRCDRRKRKETERQWKERAKEKRRKKAKVNFWSERRSWSDLVDELRRREQLERDFVRKKSDERLEKRVRGMVWGAMRICRSLDERAGCPPSFVNGLWAPLYEQETLREHHCLLPEGWVVQYEDPAPKAETHGQLPQRIYRHTLTGEERYDHPSSEVERLLKKAEAAERTNQHRFHSEPRLFLGEIVKYLREDHSYHDLDDDMADLEEEEQARDGSGAEGARQQQEYDF